MRDIALFAALFFGSVGLCMWLAAFVLRRGHRWNYRRQMDKIMQDWRWLE